MPRTSSSTYTSFGDYVALICTFYGISVSDLARASDVSRNTLLDNLGDGKSGPSKETTRKVWDAITTMTQHTDLHETLPISKEVFYTLAGYATPEQQEAAKPYVVALKYFVRRIQELEEENNDLRSQRRPRK